MGWQDRITELIPVEIMCPAVGQARFWRSKRARYGGAAHELVRKLDHVDTRIAVTAERAMLEKLEGGCQVPIGGYAFIEKGVIQMRAIVASPDGKRVVRAELSGVDPMRTRHVRWGETCWRRAPKRFFGRSPDAVYEGLSGGRRSRRSRINYRQGQEDPGARRRRPLRQPCERAFLEAGACTRDSRTKIYVGKKRAQHEMSQEEISAVMIDRARRGWTVVRLKGGDPFIFGRGGEEIEALAAAGIPFEIVPGVTTPLGLAAYTGVPLTHREHTSAVTFVTGQPKR